jgi:hypothetical protein
MDLNSPINHTILFHGNCIDGWFSTYIAHSVLALRGTVKMFPISPSQKNTWPSTIQIAGTHVLLLDVSVPQDQRLKWLDGGALSVTCIDHHATAIEHWPEDACPINVESCAALQTWQYFYPGVEVPFWLNLIDRIDRWDNPTYEDRCIREILNIIAHKPVEKLIDDAFGLTGKFLLDMATPEGINLVITEGRAILEQKDAALLGILARGSFHTFTDEYVTGWNLPSNWLGANVFIIDNTHITLDTTEAAHILFEHYPDTDIFINYRRKIIHSRGVMPTIRKTMYVYSARSRGFDLTANGSVLQGHKTSAGTSLIQEEVSVLPFILTSA